MYCIHRDSKGTEGVYIFITPKRTKIRRDFNDKHLQVSLDSIVEMYASAAKLGVSL